MPFLKDKLKTQYIMNKKKLYESIMRNVSEQVLAVLNEGQEVNISERTLLKLETKQDVIDFLNKYAQVNTVDRLMRFAGVVSALFNTYKIKNYKAKQTIFGRWDDNNRTDSLTIVAKSESYEVYGDNISWRKERYRKAEKPILVYYYLTNGRNGNSIEFEALSDKKQKDILKSISDKDIGLTILEVSGKIMERRREMILSGEIKSKEKKTLADYGLENIPSSYVNWAKQYIRKFLDVYGSCTCGFKTYNGQITKVSKAKDNYFVDFWMGGDSTDRDGCDYIENFMSNRDFKYRDEEFYCNVYAEDKEEVFKMIFDNAKILFEKYKK